MKEPPLLSVCIITYNHREFIEQCLDSVLMQRTSFSFEVVIGEDQSTDGTREVVFQYAEKHPDVIHVVTGETNIGAQPNYVRTIKACRGRYVAMVDGDDYWIDPFKLQKQVDFLEPNPDYAICFHPVKLLIEDETKLTDDHMTREVPETIDIYDLAKSNCIQTSSVAFRNGLIKEFPPEYYKSPVGDYFLHMLNAQFGKIKKLPDCMSVYRIHKGGVWSESRQQFQMTIAFLDLMISYFKDPRIRNAFTARKNEILKERRFISRVERRVKRLLRL